MNRFVRDMFTSKYDGRNPYGSRGGYVVDSRRDRGREYDDYNRGNYRNDYGEYDVRYNYREDEMWHPERDGRRGEYPEQYRDFGRGDVEFGKMTRRDIEEWKHNLENSDGTHGEHFHREQIENIARNMNFRDDMDIVCMTANMMYADYCNVAKKYGLDKPEFYLELAKAFLEDRDFKGSGEEKLWLYYKCIAEKD